MQGCLRKLLNHQLDDLRWRRGKGLLPGEIIITYLGRYYCRWQGVRSVSPAAIHNTRLPTAAPATITVTAIMPSKVYVNSLRATAIYNTRLPTAAAPTITLTVVMPSSLCKFIKSRSHLQYTRLPTAAPATIAVMPSKVCVK